MPADVQMGFNLAFKGLKYQTLGRALRRNKAVAVFGKQTAFLEQKYNKHCGTVRTVQTATCNVSQFIYFCKTLYMFQTVFF